MPFYDRLTHWFWECLKCLLLIVLVPPFAVFAGVVGIVDETLDLLIADRVLEKRDVKNC